MLNFDDEVWKAVVGFVGRYEVSNKGRVRAIVTNHGKVCECIKPARQRSATCEYLYVQLWTKDRPTTEAVHRAVAKAFVPNPDNKPMVNHIDGCKLNNNASNLEWVTCSENHRRAIARGLRAIPAPRPGAKVGDTSRFHNVLYDSARKKWKASIKVGGMVVGQKRFVTENEAAQHVNKLLDEHGITDRPRNVIE